MKTFYTSAILMCLLCTINISTSFAQKTIKDKSQQEEINELKKAVKQLKIKNIKDSIILSVHKKAYDFESEMKRFQLEVRSENSTIILISYIIGGLSLLAILAGFLEYIFVIRKSALKKITKLVEEQQPEFIKKINTQTDNVVSSLLKDKETELEKKADKQIKSGLEEISRKKEEIQDMLEYQQTLNHIYKHKKIKVITENENIKKQIESFFLKLDLFQNTDYKIIHPDSEPELDYGFDILIVHALSDIKETAPMDDLLAKIMQKDDLSGNRHYIYFGAYSNTKTKYNELINAANSEITLYSQLINTLLFQEYMKPKAIK